MAIQFIQKEKIDQEKWDSCIRQSVPALPYGLFTYLNISTRGHFGGLVQNDYEAVMPVPLRKHLIEQPFISQQLGVFSAKSIDEKSFYQHLKKLAESIYLKIHNDPTFDPGEGFQKKVRTNYLLALQKSYNEIQAGYSKTLRKRIRRQKEQSRLIEKIDLKKVISAYQDNLEEKVKVGQAKYNQAKALFSYCLEHDLAKTFAVEDESGELLATGIFLFFEKRIINVFAASTKIGLEKQGMALLLDAIFEKYAGGNYIFDFEGSDIPGVKAFFQSFGPEEQPYLEISLDRRSGWRKMMDKMSRKIKL